MSNHFKKDLLRQFADIAKLFGNANRLEILEILAQGERSVEDLAKTIHVTVGNTSQHLQNLRAAGLVSTRSEGNRIYYSITSGKVVEIINAIQSLAEQHDAKVQQLIADFLISKDEYEPVDRIELVKRMQSGQALVIDVRPSLEFHAGHVPGAKNITLNELEKELRHLPRDKEIIAYCRGPYCMLAFQAVETLRRNGFNARRMQDGFPEWKNSHLPIEASTK